MAKNKNKNQKQSMPFANNQTQKPKIVKSDEIVTTEEGERLCNEALTKVEEYCEEKRLEAEKLLDEANQSIEQLKIDTEDKVRKELKKEIEDTEKKVRDMIVSAESYNQEQEELLKQKLVDVEGKLFEITKEIAKVESNKIQYKAEVLESLKDEMSLMTEEQNKFESELTDLRKKVKNLTLENTQLEEDYNDQSNLLSTYKSYKTETISLNAKIEDLNANVESMNNLYKSKLEENNTLRDQINLYGDDPKRIFEENVKLKSLNNDLETKLVDVISKEEIAEMRQATKKLEEANNRIELINAEKIKLENDLLDYRVDKDEIATCRRFIKILELQKSELQNELDRIIQLHENKVQKVFATLSNIDKESFKQLPNISITLFELCNKFKSYLANRNHNPLYYTDQTIRTFIAGFAASKLMILEGLSGTGKSSLPRAFAEFTGGVTKEVPVQSSWKDRNDLLGFYNDFKKQYKETEFLKALYQASVDKDNIYCIVLDEMNLSRIEYYFADLLSVLEKPNIEDWKVDLISDYSSVASTEAAWPNQIIKGKLQIKDNVWFIGTANKDDSTFIITDKVYDRAVVLNFDEKGQKDSSGSSNMNPINNEDFQNLLRNAKKFKSENDRSRYTTMLKTLDECVRGAFEVTFGNRIQNQMESFVPVYIACGGTVDEAVDIMFSKKILRKLEGLYGDEIFDAFTLLEDEINSKKYNMPASLSTIKKLMSRL